LIIHLDVFYRAHNIVIGKFFCTEIKKANLIFGLSCLAKQRVRFAFFCHSQSQYSVKRVNFYQIVVFRANNFPLFDLFLFIFDEWTPSEYILFDLVFQLLIQDKSDCISFAHNSRVYVYSVLKFLDTFFSYLDIVL